ncbi:TetR/AcrR family transcriptional regulator [Nocardia sp. NPDC056000]|uniref:TetR/AcrR family transcriptional regulator n=1 Tax=Nocardia sp. NPDC056000 TaxID=3345674 RepID=UPI0035E0D730
MTPDSTETARRRGPGRPPNPQHTARRRQALVDAAIECFATTGYHDTAVTDITERAGVGRGSFYLYFDSKREMLDAVFDSVLERIVGTVTTESLGEPPRSSAELAARVRRTGEALLALLDENPGLVRIVTRESMVDNEISTRLMGLSRTLEAAAAAMLAEAIATGAIRPDLDPEFTAHALVGVSVAGLLRAIRGDLEPADRTPYMEALERFTTQILAGPIV